MRQRRSATTSSARRRLAWAALLAGAAAALAAARPARAWEAETTHAGLTEQAALASRLHDFLGGALGLPLGLYQPLTIRRDAPALHDKLGRLDPAAGAVPDGNGRQPALGWLLVGAAVEDVPGERGVNHFFDPAHRTGLTGVVRDRRPLEAGGAGTLAGLFAGRGPRRHGQAAPAWVLATENDLGVARFWLELEAATAAPTRAERERHLALALVVAGAVVHVLEDVGSPSRARDDLAEHLRRLGAGPRDRGSWFERLAALAYGRLGVPAPAGVERRARLADFFASADGTGLADRTAARWFSSGTLPPDLEVPPAAQTARRHGRLAAPPARDLRFPSPRPPAELDLVGARRGVVVLRDPDGVCLAGYRVDGARLRWSIDAACADEQLAAILPQVGAYAAGLLDWLFRGRLTLAGGEVLCGDVALGAGTLRVFAEDAAGTRRLVGAPVSVGGAAARAALAGLPAAPADARRLVAVFRGVDAAGEPLVAIGQLATPADEPAPTPADEPAAAPPASAP